MFINVCYCRSFLISCTGEGKCNQDDEHSEESGRAARGAEGRGGEHRIHATIDTKRNMKSSVRHLHCLNNMEDLPLKLNDLPDRKRE